MTILTSSVADPQIMHAVMTGELISDDVAQTIASGFHSPARVDAAVTALSHGLEFDAHELLTRVNQLIKSKEFNASDVLVDLHALREWTLARVPHIVVEEYEFSGDAWEQWCDQWRESGQEQPDGVKPVDRDVTLAVDAADNIGEWSYPGDASYPADVSGYEVDKSDNSVWIAASLTDAGAALLGGELSAFWAESYGGNPFEPGVYWWESDRFDEQGPNRPYASRYINPYTGDVQIKLARLVGFTDEQQAEIYRAWKLR